MGQPLLFTHIMKKYILVLSFALAALLSVGCGGNRLPDGVLGHDQMVAFLADAYMVEGYYAVETNYTFDSITPEMVRAYDDILEHHGITREQFDASLEYYSHHPELYNAINKEVEAIVNEKATSSDSAEPVAVKVSTVL